MAGRPVSTVNIEIENQIMNADASAVIQSLSEDQMKGIDWIALFDHSGSMGRDSLRFKGKTRWEELQEDAEALCRTAAKYDSDGITVIAFSDAARIYDGVTVEAVTRLFAEVQPGGSTNLADALQLAVDKAKQSSKNVVIKVFTDGSPNSASDAFNVINAAGKALGRPKIGIVFIQVGKEKDARQFLDSVNNSLSVDVVGVVPEGVTGLTLGQLGWIAQNQ